MAGRVFATYGLTKAQVVMGSLRTEKGRKSSSHSLHCCYATLSGRRVAPSPHGIKWVRVALDAKVQELPGTYVL